mmetsp:Transcript_66821/g.169454  ORF Transcript_66821/g.169454 Transcript_66821/m.169454 type:complete len:216 (+) Transcript_66821:455-1102(+)
MVDDRHHVPNDGLVANVGATAPQTRCIVEVLLLSGPSVEHPVRLGVAPADLLDGPAGGGGDRGDLAGDPAFLRALVTLHFSTRRVTPSQAGRRHMEVSSEFVRVHLDLVGALDLNCHDNAGRPHADIAAHLHELVGAEGQPELEQRHVDLYLRAPSLAVQLDIVEELHFFWPPLRMHPERQTDNPESARHPSALEIRVVFHPSSSRKERAYCVQS